MPVAITQVDAFTDKPFAGNPAAVCVLPEARDAQWMQWIAREMNLSETAFLVRQADGYNLRWFTPAIEVDLCGHATLASAHALFAELGCAAQRITFETQSGPLIVERQGRGYRMDFPASPPRQIELPVGLASALGAAPREVWAAQFLIALYDDEATVRKLSPDIGAIKQIASAATQERGNVAVSALAAAGSAYDVVSRFFAPGSGIPEDPTTGALHTALAPLFCAKLGRPRLKFHQAYPGRGGDLECELRGDRVLIGGGAVTVAEGRLRVAL